MPEYVFIQDIEVLAKNFEPGDTRVTEYSVGKITLRSEIISFLNPIHKGEKTPIGEVVDIYHSIRPQYSELRLKPVITISETAEAAKTSLDTLVKKIEENFGKL